MYTSKARSARLTRCTSTYSLTISHTTHTHLLRVVYSPPYIPPSHIFLPTRMTLQAMVDDCPSAPPDPPSDPPPSWEALSAMSASQLKVRGSRANPNASSPYSSFCPYH